MFIEQCLPFTISIVKNGWKESREKNKCGERKELNKNNSQTDRIHYVNRILNQRLINVVRCSRNSNFTLALAKLAREPNGILFLIYSPNRREHLGKFVKISNELTICLAGTFFLVSFESESF